VDRSNPAGKYKKRKEITKSKGQMYLRIFWELFSNPPFLSHGLSPTLSTHSSPAVLLFLCSPSPEDQENISKVLK
jgi:hypothetical protein